MNIGVQEAILTIVWHNFRLLQAKIDDCLHRQFVISWVQR